MDGWMDGSPHTQGTGLCKTCFDVQSLNMGFSPPLRGLGRGGM